MRKSDSRPWAGSNPPEPSTQIESRNYGAALSTVLRRISPAHLGRMSGKSGINSRLGLEFRKHTTAHRKSASITSFHQGVSHDPGFPRQIFNIA